MGVKSTYWQSETGKKLLASGMFLGVFLIVLAYPARADTMFKDDFESGLNLTFYNQSFYNGGNYGTFVISNVTTDEYVSPTHSLNMGNLGGQDLTSSNLSFLNESSNDLWFDFSIRITTVDQMNFEPIEIFDTAYTHGIGLYNNAGNWEAWYYNDTSANTKIITTNQSFANDTWTNITIHFINPLGASNSVEIYFNDTDVYYANLTEPMFYLDGGGNIDVGMFLWGSNDNNYTYYDDVCIHNESLKYDCFYEAPCVPSWNCTAWSACVRGYQTRECTDDNQCGDNRTMPALSQSCFNSLPNATFNITESCCPISQYYCTDNETLVQLWNTSEGVSWAVAECNYGCDNATSACSPAPYEANLWTLAVIIGIIIAIAVLYRWSKR